MADSDRNNSLKASYQELINLLKLAKYERPNAYADIEWVVRSYRQWVLDVADIDTLAELPKP